MLKVLIVDDEPSIRENMPYVIEWEKYGFSVIGQASNGKEALEKIKAERPDLIISDIRMPVMDGLTLIERIDELKMGIKVIILSGYDEFDYAKKAIEYNASGYLLKPVEEEELIGLLEKVKTDIEKNNKNKKVYLNHMIRIMTAGLYTIEMPSQFEEENMLRNERELYFLSIELDNDDDSLLKTVKANDEEEGLPLEIINKVIDIVGKENEFCVQKLDKSKVYLVAYGGLLKKLKLDVSGLADKIQQSLRELTKQNISIFVGKKADGCMHILESRESIELCKKHRFYLRNGVNIEYEKIKDKPFGGVLEDTSVLSELAGITAKGQDEEIDVAVERLCNVFKENNISPESVKMYVNSLAMDLMIVADELGGSKEAILLKFNMLDKLTDLRIKTVSEFLKTRLKETGNYLRGLRKERFTGIIGDVVDYIYENFENDINLSKISEKYHFNTCYLGQLFKRKVGVNFNTFLIGVRIAKAKKLLENPEMKIFEISDKVGFKDPNYFCVKFMEFEKMSPSKYRREVLEQNTNE